MVHNIKNLGLETGFVQMGHILNLCISVQKCNPLDEGLGYSMNWIKCCELLRMVVILM